MKLDTHVHTFHSGQATDLSRSTTSCASRTTRPRACMRRRRRAAWTSSPSPTTIRSAARSALGDRPDVIVGCEVTAEFADVGPVCAPQRARHHAGAARRDPAACAQDVRELMPYLQRAGHLHLAESRRLRHQRSADRGAPGARSCRGWTALEVINGTRLPSQNRTAMCLAQATGKHRLGGGDSHTGRGIGLTWTEVPGARTREEFMAGLRAGRARSWRRPRRQAHDDVGHVALRRQLHDRSGDDDGATSGRLARLRLHVRRHPGFAAGAARDDRRLRALPARTAIQSGLCCTTCSRAPGVGGSHRSHRSPLEE